MERSLSGGAPPLYEDFAEPRLTRSPSAIAAAEQTDRQEGERYGRDRGDEPPEEMRSREQRRVVLAEAKARLEAERARELESGDAAALDAGIELDLEALERQRQGRRSWQREASHQLDAHREQQAAPVARGRRERLEDAKRRLEQELAVDTVVNAADETFHASGRDTLGRRTGNHPKPYTPPLLPEGTVNLTDPDSRLAQDKGLAKVQGYNAQAAVSTDGQIVIAAEISVRSPDFGHLGPVFDAAVRDLRLAGVPERPGTVLADTGYWHGEQTDAIVANGTQVLIPPESGTRKTPRPGGPTDATGLCARCSPPTPVTSSTDSEPNPSSRRSGRSSTTAGSGNSDDEAGAPHDQNGG